MSAASCSDQGDSTELQVRALLDRAAKLRSAAQEPRNAHLKFLLNTEADQLEEQAATLQGRPRR